MDRQQIQQIAQQIGPQIIAQAVSQVMSEIDPGEITSDQLKPLIATLERTLIDPRAYPQARRDLIEADIAEPDDLPEQFDPSIVILMVIVLNQVAQILQQREQGGRGAAPAQFARGGLNKIAKTLQAKGRNGDTILAHINPMEAAMLKRAGGAGTINPRTGLPEFGFFGSLGKSISGAFKSVTNAVKGVVKSLGPIAPILLAAIAPMAIPALAPMLGGSTMLAGALYGAGTSALTGGNVLQGAVMGGLGGGLGEMVGGKAAQLFGTSLSPATQALVGNTLVGGALGAATGQGFAKGAMGAATGTMLGSAIGNLAGQGAGTAFGQGLTQAGKTIGQMTTAGIPLKQALIGGALSGLTSGVKAAYSSPLEQATRITSDVDTQIENVQKLLNDPSVPETAKQAYTDYLKQLTAGKESLLGTQKTLGTAAPGSPEYKAAAELVTKPGTAVAGAAPAPTVYEQLGIAPSQSALMGGTNVGLNMPTAMVVASAAAPFMPDKLAAMQTPQDIQNALRTSNPEYFDKLRLNTWDWNDLQQKAATAGVPLGTYVASNWNDLTKSTQYTSPGGIPPQPMVMQAAPVVQKARGGALSKIAYLARGSGSGRDDKIEARLSDGEYVMDAETVALLGDGSTQAGARRLDEMRKKIRQQKGRALARGKFSPNAKSPLNYIKGVM